MPRLDSPVPALARWLAHGVTSRTHPVLHWALEAFFHPLGIEAEALEAEPFGALESGRTAWWLRRPVWHPDRLDRRQPAASDFEPIFAELSRLSPTVDARGFLRFESDSASRDEAAAILGWPDIGWLAARHSLRAAQRVEGFIFTAAGLILANDPAAVAYADGDDASYCADVCRRLDASSG